MKPDLKQRIKDLICKVFGHFPANHWEYSGEHADCKCCGKVVTKNGKGRFV